MSQLPWKHAVLSLRAKGWRARVESEGSAPSNRLAGLQGGGWVYRAIDSWILLIRGPFDPYFGFLPDAEMPSLQAMARAAARPPIKPRWLAQPHPPASLWRARLRSKRHHDGDGHAQPGGAATPTTS